VAAWCVKLRLLWLVNLPGFPFLFLPASASASLSGGFDGSTLINNLSPMRVLRNRLCPGVGSGVLSPFGSCFRYPNFSAGLLSLACEIKDTAAINRMSIIPGFLY